MKIIWEQEDWDRLDQVWGTIHRQLIDKTGSSWVHVYYLFHGILFCTRHIDSTRKHEYDAIYLFRVRRSRPKKDQSWVLKVEIMNDFLNHLQEPLTDFLNMLWQKEQKKVVS